MKFRKISFRDNPILGNVSFDFTDVTGKTVDTIILAGENGCGKSYLLSFLNTYDPRIRAKDLGFNMQVEVEFSDENLKQLHRDKDFENVLGLRFTGRIATFVHDTSFKDDNSRVRFVNREGQDDIEYAYLFANNPDVYKSVFSDVEINFDPGRVQHTTSSNLDSELSGSTRSSHNLATEIKQLLVDINELDNDELAAWVDSHRGQVPSVEILHRRIRRFTDAFDKIFPHKHFVGINNKDNSKVVLFEEFGKQMEISQLSSGEKQIAFRGGFLLRNLGTINGAIVMVDEPELSLHPQWQLRILGFLKSLFTDENGKQTSQLIVATHSPFILHNDTRVNDKVIVLQKDDKGVVNVLDKPEYFTWSSSTAIEDAFNISPLLQKEQVVVFLEGETDELYYKKAVEVFGFDPNVISFNWIGHYVSGNKGRAENTGDAALNSAASFFKANPFMMQLCKVYLLYDCDTSKPDEQEGHLYVGAMKKNTKATQYQIGVENLLQLPTDFDYPRYYRQSVKTNGYGATSTVEDLDKKALSRDIISMANPDLEIILSNLKKEIETILRRTGK